MGAWFLSAVAVVLICLTIIILHPRPTVNEARPVSASIRPSMSGPSDENMVGAASGFFMPSQAVDDDAVHFGKLLGSESVDPSFDPPPGGAAVPAGTTVGRFDDVLRFYGSGMKLGFA